MDFRRPPGLRRCAAIRICLTQAVLNLVTNAMGACPKGGACECTWRRGGDKLIRRSRIRDSGIPAELRDKVFQLYFTTKPKDRDRLAMTLSSSPVHNGTISFKSEAIRGRLSGLSSPRISIMADLLHLRAGSLLLNSGLRCPAVHDDHVVAGPGQWACPSCGFSLP